MYYTHLALISVCTKDYAVSRIKFYEARCPTPTETLFATNVIIDRFQQENRAKQQSNQTRYDKSGLGLKYTK